MLSFSLASNTVEARSTSRRPTSWLLARIYCTGTPEDYAAVHKLQDECKLVPPSAYGKPYTPPAGKVDPSIDMKTAVREQVNRMDAVYFKLLCELMKTNPPYEADAPQLAKFARIGIVPGQEFDESKLKADFPKRVLEVSFDRIMLQFKVNKAIKDENGFAFTTRTGIYGTDYLMRGPCDRDRTRRQSSARRGLPDSQKEADGRKYNGAAANVMRSPRALPSGGGLLVAHDVRQRLFLCGNNQLNRYSPKGKTSSKIRTAPPISTFRKDSPAKTRRQTGFPRLREISSSCCACTGCKKPICRSSAAGHGRSPPPKRSGLREIELMPALGWAGMVE